MFKRRSLSVRTLRTLRSGDFFLLDSMYYKVISDGRFHNAFKCYENENGTLVPWPGCVFLPCKMLNMSTKVHMVYPTLKDGKLVL